MTIHAQRSYVVFHFYNDLNDFLSPKLRKKIFTHKFNGVISVKDLIESLGVPHTEIDSIVVNGKYVDFTYHVQCEDQISVYPMFKTSNKAGFIRQRLATLTTITFIVDNHLGKLVKYLRMLGFDTLYDVNYSASELAAISNNEKRILLTRDRGLLKRRIVEYGRLVRQTQPLKQ